VVLIATVRALKSHGGGPDVTPGKPLAREYVEEHLDLVRSGCKNLVKQVRHQRSFTLESQFEYVLTFFYFIVITCII
jgi:methylenetetrahydrofolate dehydrogenase (NADP+)/methenyltetrahydrofolate cyclohydrolase/formyltetrahydrofolate synthetase